MTSPSSYPYEAIASKKYKSPHKNDLSFAKGDRIRVLSLAPKDDDDDDEDEDDDDEPDQWLLGETLDRTKSGTFPASHVQAAASETEELSAGAAASTTAPTDAASSGAEPIPSAADVAPSSKNEEEAQTFNESAREATDMEGQDSVETESGTPAPVASGVAATAQPSEAAAVKESAPAETASPAPTSSPAAPVPERKPTSPPLAPKPSGLAARIAAFNRPQEAPPPLPKGKPGAWKRPAPAPGAPKPLLPEAAPGQQAKPTSASGQSQSATAVSQEPSSIESGESRTNAGFSAADAQSSIKMSLKERMAALQRGDSSGESAASKPAAPAKAAPGRITEEKRKGALAGLGAISTGSGDNADAEKPISPIKSPVEEEAAPLLSPQDEAGEVEDGETTSNTAPTEEGETEKTEEEKESDRRAAIAKRMAALGGRKMGAGPAMFGAPPPKPAKKPSAEPKEATPTGLIPDVTTEKHETAEDVTPLASPITAEPEQQQPEPPTSGQTLAVPRRAAPPRKKKSSASSTHSVEQSPAESKLEEQDKETPSRQNSKASRDGNIVEVAETEDGDRNGLGTASAGAAAGASTISVITDTTKGGTGKDVADEPVTTDVASSFGDMTSDFEPGTPISERQMDENARKLEEFVRTPKEEAGDGLPEGEPLAGGEEEEIAVPQRKDSIPPVPIASPPPQRTDSAGITSRPPSTRPPVPKTPLPSEDIPVERYASPPPSRAPPVVKASQAGDDTVLQRLASPAPTRAPPIPQSALRRDSIAEGELADEESSLKEPEEEPDVGVGKSTPVLAAPKPRTGVSTDDFDEDDEEMEEKQQNAAVEEPVATSGPVAAASTNTEELTEEEEDRQRRARIAAKMARMGGQPIMGAPMAFKKSSVGPAAEEKDLRGLEPEPDLADKEPGEAASGEASIGADADAEEEPVSGLPERSLSTKSDLATDAPTFTAPPVPLAKSPPPMPVSPPPMPTKSPPPTMAGGAMEKRLSQINASEDSSLGRRASLLSRPPIPGSGMSSREASTAEQDEADNREEASFAPPVTPKSPPPRAPPSRAPPPVRKPSLPQEEAAIAPVEGTSQAPQQQPTGLHRRAQSASRSSRDLDLMPSSQWWRHGKPVKLPPTLSRPDVLAMVSTQDEGSSHLIRVDLIFEDYSSTVVEVQYEDDDAKEEATQLSQQHHFAPRRPSTGELQSWSQQFGSPLARQAASALQSKASIGDGTSKGFITALVHSTGIQEILPPVGASFGSIILAQAATTPVDIGADEIRSGDIVALHGVDLKGKKGLTPYHATFGSTQDPTYACIIEFEAKKRKLRCILVAGVEARKSSSRGGAGGAGSVEETSLRLDDVKSGLLRVFRLAPRTGWLSV